MKRVLGLDIGRGSAVGCILDQRPKRLKEYLQNNKRQFKQYSATAKDMQKLLAEDFDIAVLEPTGSHYARIWSNKLEAAGREVLWVSHEAIANHRKSYRLPNKSDPADALALADYGLEHLGDREFFLATPFNELRDLYLQLQSLNSNRHPAITRLRQQLTHEWPEVQKYKGDRPWTKANPPTLWRFIAGEEAGISRYQQKLEDSIGTGLSDFSRMLAGQICSLERHECAIEKEISALLQQEVYRPYIRALTRLEFGPRLQAIALSHIYPIEKFLRPDGRVRNDHVRTQSGKRSRRNRSLAAFKMSLGMGMTLYQSGDKTGWRPGGPKYVRSELWRWAKTAVVMRSPKKQATIELRRRYDIEREAGIKSPIRVSRICWRGTEMAFKLILEEKAR